MSERYYTMIEVGILNVSLCIMYGRLNVETVRLTLRMSGEKVRWELRDVFLVNRCEKGDRKSSYWMFVLNGFEGVCYLWKDSLVRRSVKKRCFLPDFPLKIESYTRESTLVGSPQDDVFRTPAGEDISFCWNVLTEGLKRLCAMVFPDH